MRTLRRWWICLIVLALGLPLLLPAGCSPAPTTEAPQAFSLLYPPIEPLRSGYLAVSDRHELYWEVCGNPDGMPAIVLHGGPGGGITPEMRQFFDPARFFVLLFDQRGAGRSRPAGEWRENTTQLLVQDIDLLRDHVGMRGPALLFGGSWGTTLALAYAETHPERVAAMVLRGVFLGTREEIDHFYHGGTAAAYPENWARLRSILPAPERLDYPRQLFELVTGDDPGLRQQAIETWAYYEIRMSSTGMTDARAEEIVTRYADHLMPFSVLENHYMMNNCFLEEGQILRDMERIADIPTYIVHGRQDAICMPASAEKVAQRLRRVRLDLTEGAGHSQGEPANLASLVRGVEWAAGEMGRPGSGGAR